MRSKKRVGFALVGVGAALFAAAVLLLQYNRMENAEAEVAASEALNALQTAIQESAVPQPETEATLPPEEDTPEVEETFPPLPVLTVDGHDYVGYLDIPAKDLNLPVMKMVYVEDLQTAPCLEGGSPYSDDAVIAAHNYASHFGKLRELEGGETITFTDLNGESIEYQVTEVKTIAPTDVDVVRQSEHDLVLYTCTPGGQSRVMVGCDRVIPRETAD